MEDREYKVFFTLLLLFGVWWALKNYPGTVWAIAAAGAMLYATVYFVRQDRKFKKAEQQRLRAEAESRARGEAEEAARSAAKIRAKEVEQAAVHNGLVTVSGESVRTFEVMPAYLSRAEAELDQAEIEFADRAFAPFWDCIESATTGLGSFDEGLRTLSACLASYATSVKLYAGLAPAFPLARQSIESLGTGAATAGRLSTIVRTAQRDFQFATIYEQRKTNAILVAGFTSLGQALSNIDAQLATSFGDLTSSVERMTSVVGASARSIELQLQSAVEETRQYREEQQAHGRENRQRELRALEMLDNIQRRRRPTS